MFGVGMGIKLMKGPAQEIMGKVSGEIGKLTEVQSDLMNFSSVLGESWQGDDADAFVEEILTRLIPEIADLIAALAGLPGGIGSAIDIFDSADMDSSGIVGAAESIFSSIF